MSNSTRGNLYRYPDEARLGGVCAGLAHYFNMETWLVRVLVVSGALLTTGTFFVVVYVALWFILEKAPSTSNGSKEKPIQVKNQVWQSGEPPRQAMKDLNDQFERLENRLRSLEGHVTSAEFQLNRQISRL
ncbi:envelope stress response membrane protein PspC [Gallaecimonas xiamenensis]|uniref:Phage shock protein C, PspC n=1 Tax=Gallaecimonas xiamenensis 3-C-1 TaxID=745411 RepID=K2KG23_9GAMM|nr:envelope stress response membrane protein PspC [Gallaecimonas xiamenensis]EKE76280.1 phage shock protein C, PspC [Gallaecimonas xiamenensis 3-C-1]